MERDKRPHDVCRLLDEPATRSIMKQAGHRSLTVVRRYIRDVELFDGNAAPGIGL